MFLKSANVASIYIDTAEWGMNRIYEDEDYKEHVGITLYKPTGRVSGSLIGNGCKIEGTVINSVIGRNVIIKEGAVIKDSVILPDSLIDNDVNLNCVVVDRKHRVSCRPETRQRADCETCNVYLHSGKT